MATNSTRKTRARRWFRFRLRTLLLVLTAIGIVSGVWINSARRQQLAVESVKSLGGRVQYDYQTDDLFNFERRAVSPVSSRLAAMLGEDYFLDVVLFDLTGTAATDDDLRRVAGARGLRYLDLTNTGVSNEGVAHLTSLTALEKLLLQNTQVSDAVIERLPHVTQLWLDQTGITDEGLRRLVERFPGLESLGISNTKVTDKGLALLDKLDELKWLVVDSAQLSAEGGAHVRKLPALSFLWVEGPGSRQAIIPKLPRLTMLGLENVETAMRLEGEVLPQLKAVIVNDCSRAATAELIRQLKGAEMLDQLHVTNCPLEDEDVQHVIALQGLTKLELYKTEMTASGKQAVRAAFPNATYVLLRP